MSSMEDRGRAFFDACESGKGWDACREYCHDDATFSAQAPALAEITTLHAYVDWIESLAAPMPGNSYEIRGFAADEARSCVIGFGVFRATHSGEGGPVPATGRSTETEYVYVMRFEGDRIRHMTKVWNDGYCLAELGWA